MQEIIATANVVFVAWVLTLVGGNQCKALPDYSEDVSRLATAVEQAEEALQGRGTIVVYQGVGDHAG